ncbi:7266_t:CDS:2 [Diversispora eburnea]|uniref:7266_t:CDS:1 n=1 Tax=Diversispora eburnea TaxID=1213867 RepID=A0A9N8YN78_9GLOM|nr:7266_t:CDS:2 [Diversispora eburnea]
MATRVYIGRLARDARERDVEKLFRNYGTIREIKLMNGFGFVEFRDHRDADDVVYAFNGKSFMGEKFAPPQRNPQYRLIVENLSSSCSWQIDVVLALVVALLSLWLLMVAFDSTTIMRQLENYVQILEFILCFLCLEGRKRVPHLSFEGSHLFSLLITPESGFFWPIIWDTIYFLSWVLPALVPSIDIGTWHKEITRALEDLLKHIDLKDLMRKAGEVTFADCHKDRDGEGVVEFSSYEDMKNAIRKLDDTELKGKRIILREAPDNDTDRERFPVALAQDPRAHLLTTAKIIAPAVQLVVQKGVDLEVSNENVLVMTKSQISGI